MGVDNWVTCPRCMKKAIKKKEKLEKQAAECYGNVSEIQYLEILEKAQKDINLKQTLHEDYEFDMDPVGDFLAHYSAHCHVCNFTHKFIHKEQVKV